MDAGTLSIGQCASLACLLEATAPKPGNVHRGADFDDLTFNDLAVSAVAIAPAMDAAVERGVGRTVLDAVRATRSRVSTNTNLGIVLLLSPLASVERGIPLASGTRDVLAGLTAEDSRLTYEAINLAQAGSLGQVDEMDVNAAAPTDLLTAMQHAADRDMIARQYANGFGEVLTIVAPMLCDGLDRGWSLSDTIVHTHITLMARYPDSLIARKCGTDRANESAGRARQVLAAGGPGNCAYLDALADFDFWLRSDGHRRNPGTTADLIAAGVFVALREGQLRSPVG